MCIYIYIYIYIYIHIYINRGRMAGAQAASSAPQRRATIKLFPKGGGFLLMGVILYYNILHYMLCMSYSMITQTYVCHILS